MSVENPLGDENPKDELKKSEEGEVQENQPENVWDEIALEQQDQLREELKEAWEKRGFIFFNTPRRVSLKSIEWRLSDYRDWEVIAVRQRQDNWQGVKTKKHNEDHKEATVEGSGIEFLTWKPKKTQDGQWYANELIEPRHLIELNEHWQPNNDLTWVRDELEKIPNNKRGEDFDYIKKNIAETIPDKDRRKWVEKRVALEAYKKDWPNKSLEILERKDLSLIEAWKQEAETVLRQWQGMGDLVRLKTPYTLIHEELIKIQIVRDFYWHLSDLASHTGDEIKKEEYTGKTMETQKIIDEYNEFIKEKKAY